MDLMPIDAYSDWEKRIQRTDAFWAGAVLDRPVVYMSCLKAGVVPPESLSLVRDWQDPERYAGLVQKGIESTEYFGDALPLATANLGPDIFPVLYGGELYFEPATSFITHFLEDWDSLDSLKVDFNNRYGQALDRIYEALLEVGRGKFYVGYPDLHGGGDCLAAWRGPEQLCLDLYDEPDMVKAALQKITAEFLETYDRYTDWFIREKQAVTCWAGFVSTLKWHVPSNDFAYMIAPEQFREFFLSGIQQECDHMQANLYHLDGIGNLLHLDALLEIKSLNTIQWVPGDGQLRPPAWLDVYKKVQAAGKGLQIYCFPEEVDFLIENLRPEGVALHVELVPNADCAREILKKVSAWVR